MAQKKIDFMLTAFRDGFQSAYGARVLTPDFLPAVEAAAAAGVTHFEAGGGARFQALYFYCNENAFDMMDQFRLAAGPKANLQTLSRGINVVGLNSQSRDIIKLHAQMFKKHGMTTIRNFDALNDVNNLIDSGQFIHDAGLNHEVCVTMMELPPGCTGAHDTAFYIKTLKQILDANIPFSSVCFKDASGTSVPSKVHETIKEARKLLGKDARISFHSHDTAGVAVAQYQAAIEAGADQIDLSMSPVSGGTCQPDLLVMHHALKGTNYDLGIDMKKMYEVEAIFKEGMSDYIIPPEALAVEPLIPLSALPGGALTANTEMLRDNGLMDKYPAILAGINETVSRGGFGTSVTPVSQFYFQQAFNNVVYGPWKKIADGYGKMVLGYFGKTPVAPDPEIVKICSKLMDLPVTTANPVDVNDANPALGIEPAKKILIAEDLPITDENIFITATCGEKGIQFLKGEMSVNIRKKSDIVAEKESANAPASATPTGPSIKANIPGLVLRVNVKEGDDVKVGDEVVILEAMKMETAIKATEAGKVGRILIKQGQQVKPNEDLILLGDAQLESKADDGDLYLEKANLPGLVLKILVKEGDTVTEGDQILLLEAMKMESPVKATQSGTVAKILCKNSQQVTSGDSLLAIAPMDANKSNKQAEKPIVAGEFVFANVHGKISQIVVKPNASVKKNELLASINCDGIDVKVFSPIAGTCALQVKQGELVQMSQPLAFISS